MEHSLPRKSNRSSDSEEISCIILNPKVHYRIQKFPSPVPILSQNSPVQASPSHSLKIQFNIILQCTQRSAKCYFSGLLTKTLYARLLSPIRATFLAHLIPGAYIVRVCPPALHHYPPPSVLRP